MRNSSPASPLGFGIHSSSAWSSQPFPTARHSKPHCAALQPITHSHTPLTSPTHPTNDRYSLPVPARLSHHAGTCPAYAHTSRGLECTPPSSACCGRRHSDRSCHLSGSGSCTPRFPLVLILGHPSLELAKRQFLQPPLLGAQQTSRHAFDRHSSSHSSSHHTCMSGWQRARRVQLHMQPGHGRNSCCGVSYCCSCCERLRSIGFASATCWRRCLNRRGMRSLLRCDPSVRRASALVRLLLHRESTRVAWGAHARL